ncbi:tRNA pseudouridine(38-40) synthase TruA [Flavobacterium sp. CS20]|jgi:tRNA pseudouridine38-40 synthase|uniref:tRNA pseudouridine(38-40) synthase TruA n=1 Tax=Flavobacterium sp. CS20 TaxID=2775246 RepID=UPI001B3A33E5|nr:tRNA pseudouridine(38-40) synthase TruA [Flavobacterium sp. CS20]QTY26707.1 tRNA pseudouridine(38-40) synthase TruA [Flavobacterium sp. CS20]
MKRYFIQCSFWGKAYKGWQKQPEKPSIQASLDQAISTALQENIEVMGAGRTDTGVHAKKFIAHFDTTSDLKNTYPNLIYKLNTILPHDIAVQDIFEVSLHQHARFDAVSRTYQYRISTQKNPFEKDSAYYIKNSLDVKLMHKCVQQLTSFHNFKSFSKVKTAVKNFNCNIISTNILVDGDVITIELTANRFLRNMVRAISGTLVDVGLGKNTFEDFINIIKSEDRRNAGKSVPAKGLYLTEIVYPYPLNSIYGSKQDR